MEQPLAALSALHPSRPDRNASRVSFWQGRYTVQCQIERQDVHSRLAEQAPLPTFGVDCNQCFDAIEWGRFNIRVNAIAPTGLGQVFAQLVKDVPGFLDMATANNPLKRAGDPEQDIGPVVVFLASEMSRFITGEMINVDGGQNLPGYVSVPHNLAELEAGGGA